MTEHELESWIMRTLAAQGADWMAFTQLDEALYQRVKQMWRDEVRRSYLRGALGRMLHDGRIERDKYAAKYKISTEQTNLFATEETPQI